MCNCNSQWVQNARNFLQQNVNNQEAKFLIVQYLINNNKCGRNNGVYLNELLNHVNNNGYSFSRESFQHDVFNTFKTKHYPYKFAIPGKNRRHFYSL